MLRKRQFGYRLLHRVHGEEEEEEVREEEEEESSGEPTGGEGVRNAFNTARSRPPEAGAANNHVSEPSRAESSPSAADASGGWEAHAGCVTH